MSKKRAIKKALKADLRKQDDEPKVSKTPPASPKTLEFVDLVIKHHAPHGHNCLQKNAGKCHVMKPRCFEQGHMGICPGCKHAASMRHGCDVCGNKGRDLLTLKESRALVKANLLRWESDNKAVDETDEKVREDGDVNEGGEQNIQ